MIKKELAIVVKALRDDKDLYYAWQSNIAMSFIDGFNRKHPKSSNSLSIHEIANQAAKNFLDSLIKEQH